jgi:two-component system NtrC family sensor kinase
MAQETDVNRLVESVVLEQQTVDGKPKEEYAKIRIVQDLHPRLPVIQADPDQLRQCLLNLMSNAVDAMADGGTLTVSTRIPDSQHIELAVSDTGTGMDEETLSKVFTPFYTTKPPGKGTGLGLSIIYGIVKMHRGDIRVESALGQGTTFIVVLPVRLPETSRAQIQDLVPGVSSLSAPLTGD